MSAAACHNCAHGENWHDKHGDCHSTGCGCAAWGERETRRPGVTIDGSGRLVTP